MATTLNFSALSGALSQVYRPRTVRTFNARAMLLRFLEKRRGNGKNCAWTWEGTGAIGENYSDGADVSATGSDDKNPATLSWGMYRSNFHITDFAASVAASSHSPEDLLLAVGREYENSVRKVASVLNGAGYSGLGTGTLIGGLDLALDDLNTYAGVNRTTGSNAGFRAYVVDPGSLTAPTFALIRADLAAIYDACGEVPPLAFCSTAVWNKLAALFTEFRRYTQDVNIGGRAVSMDASVGAIEIDGCVFIKDKDATANRIYYINPSYVRWEYLPFAGMAGMMVNTKEIAVDDGYGALPLGMMVKPLSTAGASQKMTCQVQLQLVVEKPNSCGVRKNVAIV